MGFYGILYVEKDSLSPKRQTLSNQGAQSRASLMKDRQAAEEMKSNRDISQASAAWDFFSKVSKMPRIKGEKMQKMPRISYGNRIIDYPCEAKGRHKVIFMRIHFVSKKPLVVRIVSIEKEVITP